MIGALIGAMALPSGVRVRSEYSAQSDLTNVYVDRPDGVHQALTLPKNPTEESLRIAQQQLQRMVSLDSIYGYAHLRAAPTPRYSAFPRTVLRRIDRMNRLIRWRRQKIRERHLIHVGFALGFLAAFPVVAAIIAKLWQLAIATILG